MTDREPVTTHTFEFINSTGEHPNAPGTDHFRCVHCERELFETGIRDNNGVISRTTASISGPAADNPCEHSAHEPDTAQDTTR